MQSIAVVGLGKLGLTWALVLASKGFDVHGIDVNLNAIESLRNGKLTISEPGCDELFERYRRRLSFYSTYEEINVDISTIFIIVPTPSLGNQCFDSSYVLKALLNLDEYLVRSKGKYINVVITSTVMPGESTRILSLMSKEFQDSVSNEQIGYCYNPEFIALGSVVKDMLEPDFILIGSNQNKAQSNLSKVYKQVNGKEVIIKSMSLESAEVSKIAINTFLTLKISYANSIGMLCDQLDNAQQFDVCDAIGADSRIGNKYLKPGLGFGGPCLPRDTRAFGECLAQYGYPSPLSDASDKVNDMVEAYYSQKVIELAKGFKSPRILFCGITYKPGSWLLEESHAFKIVTRTRKSLDCKIDIKDESAKDIERFSTIWASYKDLFDTLGSDINSLLKRNPDIIVSFTALSEEEESSIASYQEIKRNKSEKLKFISMDREGLIDSVVDQTSLSTVKAVNSIYKSPVYIHEQLYKWFTHSIGVKPENAHDILDKKYLNNLLTKETSQSTNIHEKIYAGFDSDTEFLRIYEQLLSSVCKKYKIDSDRLIVQSFPTIQLQFPGNISMFEFHKDKFYNHSEQEINTFYAITECRDSSTIWLEKSHSQALNRFSTFSPLNLRPGEYAQLDTANRWNGDTPNLTSFSRLSMDFRILLSSSSLSKNRSFSGKKHLDIGSYFRYFDTYEAKFI